MHQYLRKIFAAGRKHLLELTGGAGINLSWFNIAHGNFW
jgi:hypothetical protein